jgi:uncharacterized protein YbbC (DUF1343 family)
VIGAPWLDGRRLAAALAEARLPGVHFVPTRFRPSSSAHAGKDCGGVLIYVDDWGRFDPLRTGITIACELKRLYPKDWDSKRYLRLLGHPPTLEALQRGEPPVKILRLWEPDLAKFRAVRKRYLLY